MSGLHRSSSSSKNIGNCLPSKELLDDLCSRFVLNVPEEDQQSFERILFLVEYAYWYYEDNAVENDPKLKSLSLKEFTSLLFNSCDVLRPYVTHIDDIFKDFTSYKCRVPVTGAIILDETYERCLLVKGWKGSSWSFPRGKKSKDEEDHACAIREVLEETGFDVSKLLKREEYIEFVFRQQRVRLYIVAGVTEDTVFAPLTKKEISEITWHRLDHLQPASNEVITHGVSGLKLYMVAPFLSSLKSWILKHPSPVARRPNKPLKALCVWNARTSVGGNGTATVESQNRKSELRTTTMESNSRKPELKRTTMESHSTKPELRKGTMESHNITATVESHNTKPVVDHSQDIKPGGSFINFKFNQSVILQALESGNSA
ncbi:mRNA decapping protein 2 Box A domain [Arabidopsis thaliana x Arabidopsis arenosa]|uniref:TDT n=3 Tax=Arabidopsis TaxID=3701 RepID=A0A178UGM0_ARATH|nr:mRNA decapping protein 2 Box A domain [Arabidopsis thaliana x Arabidopsis arenosa]KAG7609081.1 mRNA decapping protein 2 Box A domain [Arabidopsis suecica]OAO92968.1 TDT [Arabidopsis thaliana]